LNPMLEGAACPVQMELGVPIFDELKRGDV
jgi:hypothetical protein